MIEHWGSKSEGSRRDRKHSQGGSSQARRQDKARTFKDRYACLKERARDREAAAEGRLPLGPCSPFPWRVRGPRDEAGKKR